MSAGEPPTDGPDSEFRFRWRYSDAFDDGQWTDWHTYALPCRGCCHGGPVDGEHQSPAEDVDEHGHYMQGHTYFDPTVPDGVAWEQEVVR